MNIKITDFIWNIIACGFPKNYDIEVLRKTIIMKLFSIFGCLFLFSLGFVAYIEKNFVLFIIDYVVGIFLILFMFWMRKTKNIRYSGYIAATVIGFFYLFLIAFGGVNQTAFLWSFTWKSKRNSYFDDFYSIYSCHTY